MGWRDTAGMRLGPRPWVWQLLFFIGACTTVLLMFQIFRQPGSATRPNTFDEDVLGASTASASRDLLANDEFLAPPPLTSPKNVPAPQPKSRPTGTRADLRPVRDYTVGVRANEADAFFDLLHDAARTTPDDLELQVRYDVQYVNLMTDPERYRGTVVTVAGELQRITPFTAGRNRHDLKTLYEAWIVTPDSAPHAYRVVTSQLDDRIPLAKDVRLPVQTTGYFLKQEGYLSPSGVEIAPVILGSALDRDDSVFHPAGMATFPPWMLGLIVAGGLILTATMVSMAVTERRSARLRPLALSLPVETLTALAATPPFSVQSFLRELEQDDRAKQFETVRRPASAVNPPHVPLPKPRAERGVDMPTPTPPTRQFRKGWKRSWTEEGAVPESNDPS
jgi:hypothetical protein